MDWAGWLVVGLLASAVLAGLMLGAQLLGLTRMDLPTMLGTIVETGIDRARVIGFALHLVAGQILAIGYAVVFDLVGRATWIIGGLLGLLHGLLVLTVVMTLLPGLHPHMASERSGPHLGRALEPPGALGLNYGASTPLVTLVAHVIYGAILGGFLRLN